jgi:hypothetical protein
VPQTKQVATKKSLVYELQTRNIMKNLYYSKRNQHANNVTSWKENILSKLSSIYVLVQPEIGMECILLLFSCFFFIADSSFETV